MLVRANSGSRPLTDFDSLRLLALDSQLDSVATSQGSLASFMCASPPPPKHALPRASLLHSEKCRTRPKQTPKMSFLRTGADSSQSPGLSAPRNFASNDPYNYKNNSRISDAPLYNVLARKIPSVRSSALLPYDSFSAPLIEKKLNLNPPTMHDIRSN